MLFMMLMFVNVSVCLYSDSSLVTILVTSGPATIQRLNASGFIINAIAPPAESLTMALFCL